MLSSQGGKASRSEPFYKVVEKRKSATAEQEGNGGRGSGAAGVKSLLLEINNEGDCKHLNGMCATKIMTTLRSNDGPQTAVPG